MARTRSRTERSRRSSCVATTVTSPGSRVGSPSKWVDYDRSDKNDIMYIIGVTEEIVSSVVSVPVLPAVGRYPAQSFL